MSNLFLPVPTLLHDIDNVVIKKELDDCSEALSKFVNIGTHLLHWEWTNYENHLDVSGVCSAHFRRILEFMDSISLLIKVGSIDTAMSQLRALLESVLSFEFLLEQDTELRAYCYIVTDLYLRKRYFLNPETVNIIDDHEEGAKNIDQLLSNPSLNEAKYLYSIKAGIDGSGNVKLKQIKWYSLVSHIDTFKELSKYLKRNMYYELVYKHTSNVTHGSDLLIGNIIDDGDGTPALLQLRNPKDALSTTRVTLHIGKIAFESISKRLTDSRIDDYRWNIEILRRQYKAIFMPHLNNKSSGYK